MGTGVAWTGTALLGLVVSGCGTCVAWACDTPVYRYALYNWSSSPYVLYRFRAEPAESVEPDSPGDTAGEETGAAPAGPQRNFDEITVGQTDAAQLELVPEAALAAWREENSAVPLDVLLGPQQAVIFAGQIAEEEVEPIIDSPARQEIVRQLGAGQPCVLVVVTAGNATIDEAAVVAVDETIARGGAGKIEPARLGSDPSAAPTEPPAVVLGRVVISADDPRERWLVRMLERVERDLSEFDGQPMVFAVYGRGRAMEPYIGEGVTADNLSECVSFILGSCSCQVKDQNPGVDLLTNWDWETTALTVAQQVGQEEGNEALLDAADSRILSQVVAGPASALPPPALPPAETDDDAAATPPIRDETPRVRVAMAAPAEPTAASASKNATQPERSFADQMGLRIAAAVLLLLAVAAAGTMVLLRTRAARSPARPVS